MGEYYGLVCTILGFVILILLLVVFSFLRKMYYLIEEADARCIQIRNQLEHMAGTEAGKRAAGQAKAEK